ncbi:MAG: adenosylmethionine decarboxylase [Patescibacteria group bacterium]
MEKNQILHFGEHLTLDGYEGAFNKLNDREIVLRCLSDLPALLEMSCLSDPAVYFAEPNHLKDPGGWSGMVVIAESHISIHTFPKRGFVSIDVYTCKNNMNTAFIIDYFREVFELKDIETNFIKRGTRYPVGDIE